MSTHPPITELQELLQSVRIRWQRWVTLRTTLQALLVLVGGLWCLWVLDTFYFLSASWRNVGFVCIVLTSLLWLFTRLQKLREESPTDTQLAAIIEDSHPELEERLLAAVDYQQQHSTSNLERQLQQSTIHQAVGSLRSVELQSSLRPARTLRISLVWLGLLIVSGLFFLFFAYRTSPWQRILTPWQSVSAEPTIVIEGGNQSIPIGSSIDLAAKLAKRPRHGKLDLQLNWQANDSAPQSARLHFDEATGTYPIRWDQIDRSREYWVSSNNSFDESARYRLEVVVMPQLESANITITPPAYTEHSPITHDGALGEMMVPEGSNVLLSFISNQPIASGEVLFQPDNEIEGPKSIPLEIKEDRRTALAKIPASESGTFSIQYEDKHRFTYRDEVRRHLQVQPDQPPVVEPTQITKTERENEEPSQFDLPVHATDDYTVTRVEMIIKSSDQPARIITPVEQLESASPEVPLHFRFPLSEEELSEATEVEVSFRATDNRVHPRPNETWTDPVPLIELLDPSLIEEPDAQDKALDEELMHKLAKLKTDLEKQETDVDKLAIRSRLDQPLEGGDRRLPEELIEEQEELRLQLEAIASQFNEHALYKELAPLAQHVARHELPSAEQHLQEVQDRATTSPKDALPPLTAASQQLKTAKKQVAQLEAWLENLIKLKEEIPELSELAQRSQNLADQLTEPSESGELERQLAEGTELDQSMEDFLTRHPELAEAAQAALMQQLRQVATQLQAAANQQSAINESIVSDLGQQQAELKQLKNINDLQENLTEEEEQELQQQLARLQREIQRQQQRAATLVLQSAQQSGSQSPPTQTALELVRKLEETSNQILAGQLPEALKSSQQASKTAEQLSDSAPELSAAAMELNQTQQELSQQLGAQANRPAARHAARREGQDQLQTRVNQLENQLDRLTEQAVQLATAAEQQPNELSEQLNVPRQFLKKAEKPLERSIRRLQSHDYLLARESTRNSATMLKQAALTLNQLTQSEENQAVPIPQSFSEQIAEAANQLNNAQQLLAQQMNQQQANQQQGDAQGESPDGEQTAAKEGQSPPSGKGESPNPNSSNSTQSGSPASQNLQQAAQALQQANQQLQNQQGTGGQSESAPSSSDQEGSSGSQAEEGGTGTKQVLTADQLQEELELLSQRPWGAVSTELKSEIREATRYRHKPEYARQIESYFKQLAAPRTPQSYLKPAPKESP
ncbi:hypothetical protein Pla110_13170 [Polystyrenella longa]|uniref:Uncharacterized protein n=1 Tax=Polystyrenella longa TaxID=2528007 RepID=A0A518CK52_9PLAN|nr:DUF4175 family protein [Polystyrenella longa]QDU79606.1 hypothetical protein Pla110_13170 [Polystyrenella longa]